MIDEATIRGTMTKLDYQRQAGRSARQEILRAALAIEANGRRPTVREIALLVGISRGSVGRHVRVLTTAGLMTVTRGRNGGIALTDAGRLMA